MLEKKKNPLITGNTANTLKSDTSVYTLFTAHKGETYKSNVY